MSLDPKRGVKTKHIDFSGTQKDFDALADVIRQATEKINIDLLPEDLDIPGRISVRKKAKATQWAYPKLKDGGLLLSHDIGTNNSFYNIGKKNNEEVWYILTAKNRYGVGIINGGEEN